ncbi:hypothetical protein [Prevotella sp.]|uniref:hypothetical protein n=1 Tax=Prevotella sp. TaxID=59823 RepID=UPI003DA543E5
MEVDQPASGLSILTMTSISGDAMGMKSNGASMNFPDYDMKHQLFKDTQAENFTMDSLIKRIILCAVYIREVKTYIRISFSPHHRHRDEIIQVLQKLAA